jgi:hypothetical protein
MLWVSGHGTRGAQSSTIWVRAPDAASASEAVRTAIPVVGGVSVADVLTYAVSMEVPEEDVPALERALTARRRETGHIGPLITPASADGPAQLLVDVDAESDEDAIDLAGEAYRALRDEAGLPPADPIYRTLYPPWPDEQRPAQRRHHVLLQRAKELLDRGAPEGAVVVAQSAVEVLVARVIGQRLQRHEIGDLRGYILNDVVRKHNLNDEPTRSLWRVLTGDAINQTNVWPEYKRHLNRRNDIVHRGSGVSEADGAASVDVAQAVIEHIEQLPVRTD